MTTAIIALFIFINIIPLIENVQSYKCSDPPCWPEISGAMGENNWYIFVVNVSFNGTYDFIYYRIDGADWINYTKPFILVTNGIHLLEWTCDSNMSDIYSVEIKIDMSSPIILSLERKRIGLFTWQINVNASDEISGVNRVEFRFVHYIDTEPPYIKYFIDTELPYQAIVRGFRLINYFFLSVFEPELPIEVWDNAGNSLVHPQYG
jgi:hypothetical protein